MCDLHNAPEIGFIKITLLLQKLQLLLVVVVLLLLLLLLTRITPRSYFSRSLVLQLTGQFQICIRFKITLESVFTAVERVMDYVNNCPHEVDPKSKAEFTPVPPSWPHEGGIRYIQMSFGG